MLNDVDRALRDALHQGRETRTVEYKGPMRWKGSADKAASCALVKDILALANTDGGLIIIGIDDDAYAPLGLSPEDAASWETTKLNDFIRNFADPPINTELHRFADAGKTFIAVTVPEFSDLPHLCKRDGHELTQGTLYIRSAANNSQPVRELLDYNMVIERAVRNRQDRLLTSFRSILTGATITAGPSDQDHYALQATEAQSRADEVYSSLMPTHAEFREATWTLSRFEAERFTVDNLRAALSQANTQYNVRPPFLTPGFGQSSLAALQDGLEYTAVDASRTRFTYWQLRQSGLFHHRTLMPESVYALGVATPGTYIDWVESTTHCWEVIDCLVRLNTALGVSDEDVALQLRMTGTQGKVVRSSLGPLLASYACALTEVMARGSHALDDWRAGRVALAASLAREQLQRFNWPDPPIGQIHGQVAGLERMAHLLSGIQ